MGKNFSVGISLFNVGSNNKAASENFGNRTHFETTLGDKNETPSATNSSSINNEEENQAQGKILPPATGYIKVLHSSYQRGIPGRFFDMTVRSAGHFFPFNIAAGYHNIVKGYQNRDQIAGNRLARRGVAMTTFPGIMLPIDIVSDIYDTTKKIKAACYGDADDNSEIDNNSRQVIGSQT